MAQNPIKLALRQQRLDPTEAEVWVSVIKDPGQSISDMDGRFVGPRCRYASTVEVAYPLRPVPHLADDPGSITKRVVIPEPSMWTPQSPFLYEVSLRTVEGDSETIELVHGLRMLEFKPQGISLNGQRFTPKVVAGEEWSDSQMERLRQQEVNTLLVDMHGVNLRLWDRADQLGFFIVGELSTAQSLPLTAMVGQHPCTLGWLIDQEMVQAASPMAEMAKWQRFGIRLSKPTADLPAWASFVAGEANTLSKLEDIAIPKLCL